tara:strand:- start:117 stop:869 length:753 start_codon:yes stop_codon:yes gene_type:complete
MAGMLYFYPNKDELSREDIEAVGLDYAIDKSPAVVQAIGTGTPAKTTGSTFANGGMPKMNMANQTWAKMVGTKKLLDAELWCGYETRPTPEDLKRESMIAGNEVTLADGNKWMIPLVRDAEGSTRLPQFLSPSEDGDGSWMVGGMTDVHQHLWDGCGKFMEFSLSSMSEDGEVEFEWDELLDVAADLISANYRVGKDEIGSLRLCSVADAIEILKASVDWHELERRIDEAAKKNDQPDESTLSTPTGDST